jgi:hypothetical protein
MATPPVANTMSGALCAFMTNMPMTVHEAGGEHGSSSA